MRRTLYEVLTDTRRAASDLRAEGIELDGEISQKLTRFEMAIDRALASSRDGVRVGHPEEVIALNALCDLHLAVQRRPEALRDRVRPIVDDWIAYAACAGVPPQEPAFEWPEKTLASAETRLSSRG